jgi:hypothetical protein
MKKRRFPIGHVLFPALVVLMLAWYFLPTPELIHSISLPGFLILLIVTVVYFIIYYSGATKKMRKKLTLLESEEVPLDKRQAIYMDVYKLYLKLSEKHKENFYAQIVQLREKLEQQLHATKQVEHLSQQTGKGTPKQRKQTLESLHKHYENMPPQAKKEFYPHLLHARTEK